jgi:hypothetical protein
LWKRSIFPVVVGERGLVSRPVIPFSRQIRSNITSTGCGRVWRPVNCLPVVGQHLGRDPVAAQRSGERLADRPPRLHHQHRGDDEPGVVVDPGQQLGGATIGQRDPADDVELP